jgi:serine/threonine protein kinase
LFIYILQYTIIAVYKKTMDVQSEIVVNPLRAARATPYSSHYKPAEDGKIGGYKADVALGSGRFATVWKASSELDVDFCQVSTVDIKGPVAIKVYRSGRTNQEYWRNEVKILNLIAERAALLEVAPPNIIAYHGTFAIVKFDDLLEPNIHPCIVFGLAGDSISKLLKHCNRQYSAGIPLECARKIIRDAFRGLEFIHAADIIHTDIKPSNLLLDRGIGDIDGLQFNVLLGDFGSSTPTDNLFSQHVGTDLYLAPELLLERKYTPAIDIWAMFVTAFELVTGDPLFDVFHEYEIQYGSDVDNEALDGLKHDDSSDSVPELIPGPMVARSSNPDMVPHADQDAEMVDAPGVDGTDKCGGSGECDGCTGCCGMDCGSESNDRSSGSEDPEQLALAAYRHLLLMEKVLGPPGKQFTKTARIYYNSRGKLKNNPAIEHISLCDLLLNNYNMSHVECKALEGFLLNGLKYNPDERITAAGALELQWLK